MCGTYQYGHVIDKVAHEQYGHHVTDANVLDERHAFGQTRGATVGGRHGHRSGGRQVTAAVLSAVTVTAVRGAAAHDGGRGREAVGAIAEQRAGGRVDQTLGLVRAPERVVLVVVQLHQSAGRAVQERDVGRGRGWRRQPKQIVDQRTIAGRPVVQVSRSCGRGAIAAVANAVAYAAATAAGHRGYFGHARRQVG